MVVGLDTTVAQHIKWFKGKLAERDYAPKTLEMYQTKLKQIEKAFGDRSIDSIGKTGLFVPL